MALRDDPPALALRGIAMAQLGDYDGRASSSGGPPAASAPASASPRPAARSPKRRWPRRARPERSGRALDAAARALDALGDRANALYARLVGARRQLLVGELAAAEQTLAAVDVAAAGAPPALAARAELTRAELALRRVRVADAADALDRAHAAALAAGIPALVAEVGRVRRALSVPSARLVRGRCGPAGPPRRGRGPVRVRATSSSTPAGARCAARRAPSRSPAAPSCSRSSARSPRPGRGDVPRDRLIERAFEARAANESHRARLRVELGRLRAALRPLARIEATRHGFALVPVGGRAVVVLAPPIDGPAGAIVALLEGGESWSTSALACALGSSQRTVQRALRRARRSGGGARGRPRPISPLARARAWRIRDNLVTPGRAAGRVVSGHGNERERPSRRRSFASTVPIPGSIRCMG